MRIDKCAHLVKVQFMVLWFSLGLLQARPHNGEAFQLRQPDNSLVDVLVWGNEFYQDVESPEGFTLIRDSVTGWINYALLSADGRDYISSGVHYTNQPLDAGLQNTPGLKKHLRIRPESIREKSRLKREELKVEDRAAIYKQKAPRRLAKASVAAAAADTVIGLTLLVDFPDVKSPFTHTELINLFNKKGYGTFGSVKDYFEAVSNNHFTYINEVSDYITMSRNKPYYDTPNGYGPVREFITEALEKLEARGFDFSSVSTRSSNFGSKSIIALNILYAGTPDQGWANGLWPHSGGYTGNFSSGGIDIDRYQMTDIGDSPDISTIIHENGHLIFRWPDLYSYDGSSNTIGAYAIMSANTSNPQFPNPYFRHNEGWIDVIDITNAPKGSVFDILSNSHTAFLYSGATTGSRNEMYYIEARQKKGRHADLPDEGLLIWHIDEDGDNTYAGNDYLVAVEQADGEFDMENGRQGGPGDLFHAGDKDSFNDNTTPSAKWHNGSNSNMDIANISEVGERMLFTIGSNVEPNIKVFNPVAEAELEQNKSYKITWFDNFNDNVTIELLQSGAPVAVIENSLTGADNGREAIYNWLLGEEIPLGTDYSIRISSTNNRATLGLSSGTFSIIPEFRVTAFPYLQTFDNFEIGNQLSEHWEQSTDDDIDWTILSGATPSKSHPNGGGTGPDDDHTPNNGATGNYIYTEASSPNNPQKKLDLLSPVFDLTRVMNPSLSFWVHMFSADGNMGDVWLDINTDGTWAKDLIHLTGDHGDEWFNQTLDLEPYIGERVQFRFRSVTGSQYDGDICIDDFAINGTPVPINPEDNLHLSASALLRNGNTLILQNFRGMLSLHNLDGNKILDVNSDITQRINISHLANGIYFLKSNSGNFKFIK